MTDQYAALVNEWMTRMSEDDDINGVIQDRAFSRFNVNPDDDDAVDKLMNGPEYQRAFDDEQLRFFEAVTRAAIGH